MNGIKKLLTGAALFTLCTAGAVQAQQTHTLIDGDVDHGGFGGPVTKVSSVGGETAVFFGGRGGWIVNFHPHHTVVLGGGGYGLTTRHQLPSGSPTRAQRSLEFGYAGPEVEYVYRPHRLLHMSVGALLGGGAVNYRNADDETMDEFFVAEPGANLLVNVTEFARLGAGISYRFASGADFEGTDDAALSGLAGVVTVKFGGF